MEATAQDLLVHFVGRRRGDGAGQLPAAAALLTTEQRLANILWGGALRAFAVPWSRENRTLCASDISAAELTTAFLRGLNRRGPFEPWAVVLDRRVMWRYGMRPVVYADTASCGPIGEALRTTKGDGWESLVVHTEIEAPKPDDWTHEREWRLCYSANTPIPAVCIGEAVRAVIVGTNYWLPHPVETSQELTLNCSPEYRTERWFWNGVTLVHDGDIQVSQHP